MLPVVPKRKNREKQGITLPVNKNLYSYMPSLCSISEKIKILLTDVEKDRFLIVLVKL